MTKYIVLVYVYVCVCGFFCLSFSFSLTLIWLGISNRDEKIICQPVNLPKPSRKTRALQVILLVVIGFGILNLNLLRGVDGVGIEKTIQWALAQVFANLHFLF